MFPEVWHRSMARQLGVSGPNSEKLCPLGDPCSRPALSGLLRPSRSPTTWLNYPTDIVIETHIQVIRRPPVRALQEPWKCPTSISHHSHAFRLHTPHQCLRAPPSVVTAFCAKLHNTVGTRVQFLKRACASPSYGARNLTGWRPRSPAMVLISKID